MTPFLNYVESTCFQRHAELQAKVQIQPSPYTCVYGFLCVCVRTCMCACRATISFCADYYGCHGWRCKQRPRVVAFVTGELYGSVAVAVALATDLLACACVCECVCASMCVCVSMLLLNYACQRAYRLCVCEHVAGRVGLDPCRMVGSSSTHSRLILAQYLPAAPLHACRSLPSDAVNWSRSGGQAR